MGQPALRRSVSQEKRKEGRNCSRKAGEPGNSLSKGGRKGGGNPNMVLCAQKVNYQDTRGLDEGRKKKTTKEEGKIEMLQPKEDRIKGDAKERTWGRREI